MDPRFYLLLMVVALLTHSIMGQQALVMFPPIREESSPGLLIGNIKNSAGLAQQYNADELRQLRFHFVPQEGITQFLRLDETTGELRTQLRIDRDTLCESMSECCTTGAVAITSVTSAIGGSAPSSPATSSMRSVSRRQGPVCHIPFAVRVGPVRFFRLIRVSVGIEDINDNAPRFDTARRSFKVSETAPPNTVISLPMAKDPDAGRNGITDYKLDGGGDVFQLVVSKDRREGFTRLSLITKRRLDREQKAWYAVNVTAWDNGSPRRSGVLQVNITITDDNDCVPVFLNSSYVVSVTEDHSLTKPIIRLYASDNDAGENGRVSFAVDPSANADILNTFQINSATGEVYLHKALDYETRKHYTIPVLAMDNGLGKKLSAHAVVQVNVIDVNDQAPLISIAMGGDFGRVEVPENQNPNFAIATISVTDRDAGENGEVDCDLEQGKSTFQLSSALERNPSSAEAFYALKSLIRFDREKVKTYGVVIVCSDRGRPSRSTTNSINVDITDVNDNSPKFTERLYSFHVKENNNPRAEIGHVKATDEDAMKNGRVRYYLDPADDQNVALESESGRLMAIKQFDREKLKSFSVRVIARDSGQKKRYSATATVSVTIDDMNDNRPTFKLARSRIDVEENIPTGTEVTRLVAEDPDEGPNGQVVFETRTSTKFFHLSQKGHLSVLSHLDRETDKEHKLVVIARDNGDMPLSSSATITISVIDVNDHAPRFIIPSQDSNMQINITADYRSGSVVTRFVARDDDEGLNGEVKYRLRRQQNSPDSLDDLPFFLNEEDGDLTVVGNIDPKRQVYRLMVEAYDQGVPSKSTMGMMEIRVLHSQRANPRRPTVRRSSVPSTVVMLVACMIIVVLIVLLFLLICIVYRRNKRHYEAGHRAGPPTASRDPPAYDAITAHGMTPSNQLLLNSKLASVGGGGEGRDTQNALGKDLDEDSASEGDHLLYENDDRNCHSECDGRSVVVFPSPRPQCLPAGHWRTLYGDEFQLRSESGRHSASSFPWCWSYSVDNSLTSLTRARTVKAFFPAIPARPRRPPNFYIPSSRWLLHSCLSSSIGLHPLPEHSARQFGATKALAMGLGDWKTTRKANSTGSERVRSITSRNATSSMPVTLSTFHQPPAARRFHCENIPSRLETPSINRSRAPRLGSLNLRSETRDPNTESLVHFFFCFCQHQIIFSPTNERQKHQRREKCVR